MTDVPEVGTPIHSLAQIDALPVGSRLRVVHNHAEWYEKTSMEGDRCWRGYHDRPFSRNGFSLGGLNEVERVGPNATPPPPETLASVKTKFRDVVLRAQSRHGVDMQPIRNAFAELGIGDERITVGSAMSADQRRDTTVAIGTLLQYGDPSDPSTYGLFERTRSGWHHLMGDVTRLRGTATILRIGTDTYEVPDWMNDDTDDPEAIIRWKIQAYKVGKKTKQATRWCDVLEQTLASAGVTASLLVLEGQRVNRAEAAALPVGSVLRWRSRDDENEWMFFIRDASAGNTSGTRLSFGNRPSGRALVNSMASMVVAWQPNDGDMSIPIPNDHLRYLPVGATFAQTERGDDGAEEYRVHIGRTYSYEPDGFDPNERANYRSSSFSAPTLYIRSLP